MPTKVPVRASAAADLYADAKGDMACVVLVPAIFLLASLILDVRSPAFAAGALIMGLNY